MTDEEVAAFQARAKLVAERLNVAHPFQEGDIKVKNLEFSSPHVGRVIIDATSKNLTTCAFLLSLLKNRTGTSFVVADIIPAAKEFYGPYWDDEPGTGKHAVIDALRDFSQGVLTLNMKD